MVGQLSGKSVTFNLLHGFLYQSNLKLHIWPYLIKLIKKKKYIYIYIIYIICLNDKTNVLK